MLLAPALSFAIGIAAILIAANIFLFISTQLARRFKLSPLVISVIIIGLVTTLPELAVTLVAIQQGDVGLALGNALGSYVMNIAFVLALAIIVGDVKIGSVKTQKNALILLVVSTIFVALQFSSIRAEVAGWLLLFMLGVTFALQLVMGLNGRKNEDKKYMAKLAKLNKKSKLAPVWLILVLSLISVAGLAVGGNITVTAIGKLSLILGLSTTFLGMTLTAISTSLPELFTILVAQRKKENKVVVGTLLGSNIINVTLFPGLVAIFAASMYSTRMSVLFVQIIAVVTAFIIFKYKGRVVSTRVGYFLLMLFVVFMIFSVLSNSSG